jgi:protein TonB
MGTLMRYLGAGLCAIGGTTLVFATIDWMNRPLPENRVKVAKRQVLFEVRKERKPPPRKRMRQQQAPPRRTKPARAPLPNLATDVGGASFGIPPIATDTLAAAQDQLLGAKSALANVVMTAGAVDQPPRAIAASSPSYPARARAQGVEGYVKIRLLVGADGQVVEAKILDAQPRGVFEQSASSAVRQWRFSPATYKGQPVKLWVVQTVRFKLG